MTDKNTSKKNPFESESEWSFWFELDEGYNTKKEQDKGTFLAEVRGVRAEHTVQKEAPFSRGIGFWKFAVSGVSLAVILFGLIQFYGISPDTSDQQSEPSPIAQNISDLFSPVPVTAEVLKEDIELSLEERALRRLEFITGGVNPALQNVLGGLNDPTVEQVERILEEEGVPNFIWYAKYQAPRPNYYQNLLGSFESDVPYQVEYVTSPTSRSTTFTQNDKVIVYQYENLEFLIDYRGGDFSIKTVYPEVQTDTSPDFSRDRLFDERELYVAIINNEYERIEGQEFKGRNVDVYTISYDTGIDIITNTYFVDPETLRAIGFDAQSDAEQSIGVEWELLADTPENGFEDLLEPIDLGVEQKELLLTGTSREAFVGERLEWIGDTPVFISDRYDEEIINGLVLDEDRENPFLEDGFTPNAAPANTRPRGLSVSIDQRGDSSVRLNYTVFSSFEEFLQAGYTPSSFIQTRILIDGVEQDLTSYRQDQFSLTNAVLEYQGKVYVFRNDPVTINLNVLNEGAILLWLNNIYDDAASKPEMTYLNLGDVPFELGYISTLALSDPTVSLDLIGKVEVGDTNLCARSSLGAGTFMSCVLAEYSGLVYGYSRDVELNGLNQENLALGILPVSQADFVSKVCANEEWGCEVVPVDGSESIQEIIVKNNAFDDRLFVTEYDGNTVLYGSVFVMINQLISSFEETKNESLYRERYAPFIESLSQSYSSFEIRKQLNSFSEDIF